MTAATLQKIRKTRLKISIHTMAMDLRYAYASSIQRYFSDEFADKPLPDNFVSRLRAQYVGTGDPIIQDHEILALAAPGYEDRHRPIEAPIVVQGYSKEAIETLIHQLCEERILPNYADRDLAVVAIFKLLDRIVDNHSDIDPLEILRQPTRHIQKRETPN